MLQASFSIVDQIMIGQLGEANISALFLLAAGVFPSQILGLYTKDMDIINTGLNYLLIFGKLGFSCMGIKSQSRIICGCRCDGRQEAWRRHYKKWR